MNAEKFGTKRHYKPFPIVYYSLFAFFVVVTITLFLYFGKFSGNITGFFRIGSELPLSPYLDPQDTYIFQGQLGYDGQQFLSIALDPFLRHPDTVTTLDHPSYRYRRIFYPLLSYFLGLGNPTLIPYVMVALNCLSIILLVSIIGRYFHNTTVPQWQCLYGLLIPGVWLVLSLTTADLLSSLFAVTAIYGYRHNKPFLTSLAMGGGCLTRETLILVWLGILGMSWLKKQNKQVIGLILGIIPALLWNFYVISLNLPGYTGVSANLGLPFMGMMQKFLTLFTEMSGKRIFEIYLWLLILGVFGAVIWLYYQLKSDNRLLYIIALLYLGMFVCSRLAILNYYLDYSRVYLDVYFLLLLSINPTKIPIKTALMVASGIPSIAFLLLHS